MAVYGSVARIPLDTSGPHDLVRHGIDRKGRAVAVAWSEVTTELYSYTEDPDVVVEIFGRADTLAEARQLIDSCPRHEQMRTILDGLDLALERAAR
jgi:hypothetical protein